MVIELVDDGTDADYRELAEMERAVVEAALRLRRAEKAHWIESEVGSDPARTHYEQGVAYIKFVIACDNLVAARAAKSFPATDPNPC